MAEVRPPRITMVVNNGMANDARVMKCAVTATRAGAEVTVLGVASAGAPATSVTAAGVTYRRLDALPGRGVSPAYIGYAVRRRLGRLADAGDWARSLPVTGLYADAFVPALVASRPDLVHVHDVHLLDAVGLAGTQLTPRPAVVYDAHEYVAGLAVSGARTQRAVDAWAALERDRIGVADHVITVADAIAERLRDDHALADRPTVVHNAPVIAPGLHASRSLRQEAGVAPETALAVYSGALSAARGVDTVVRALRDVPGLHLALVAVPFPHPLVPGLLDLARSLGVADRVYAVPPVPSPEVPDYLSGADIGVSAILGDAASYDMALPNKLFEFLHAGLTVVTSDLAGMSAFVREHDLGEVFAQGDPADCARALRAAMARPSRPDVDHLREAWSWQSQEQALLGVYRSLLGDRPGLRTLTSPEGPWPLEGSAPDFS